MGDNKCKGCGQWSGRGHKCPTPTVSSSVTTPPTPLSTQAPYPDVTDRVARAQATVAALASTAPPIPPSPIEQDFPAPPGYSVGFEMIEEGDPDDPHWPDLLAVYASHDDSNGGGQCNFSVNHKCRKVTFAGDMWVDEDHRRNGLATAMVDAMELAYPGYEIDPNGFTEDGMAFWRSRRKAPLVFPHGFEEELPGTIFKHAQHPDRKPGSYRRAEFADHNNLTLPPNVLFHATTPATAEKIRTEGFRDVGVRHDRVAGDGVYLHHDPMFASQWGTAIIAVRVPPHYLTPEHAHRDTYDGSVIVHNWNTVEYLSSGSPCPHWPDEQEREDYWCADGEPPKAQPWPPSRP